MMIKTKTIKKKTLRITKCKKKQKEKKNDEH